MIEFNLIPAIKKEFLRIQRLKKIVVIVSSIVSSVVIIIFVVIFVEVSFIQKNQLNSINQQVQSDSSKLTGNNNLNKILTIQNQLASLPRIEAKSPSVGRLFNYINELTPTKAYIDQINVNFGNNSFTVEGSSDNLNTVNKFVDTLKYTNFYIGKNEKQKQLAFSNVLLSSFSYDNTAPNPDQDASYIINFNFNSDIFNNQDKITLAVPNIIATRSIIDQPISLFKANPVGSKTVNLNNSNLSSTPTSSSSSTTTNKKAQ